jgi:biopolymer transport protein ExbB/TolQ
MNTSAAEGLVQRLLSLPVFRSEWVLWLLLSLSLLSVAVMVERWFFYRRRKLDFEVVKAGFTQALDKGDFAAAAKLLAKEDCLETNVTLAGLRGYEKGPDSVEDLVAGAMSRGKADYERRLSILATLASNSPYIGLFGTVLGIVRSFKEMSKDIASASSGVMAGIAEALVATAVGLLVAIPAVVAYNVFKGMVKESVTNTEALTRVLMAELKSATSASTISKA